MTDSVPPNVRSRMMGAVKGKNTAPERLVRSALHRAGYRFRLHRRALPGNPDIVLVKFRIAVLVHGCFWHGHSCNRGKLPGSNVDFWKKKIDQNIARDERAVGALRRQDWTPVTIWACQIQTGIDRLLKRLARDACKSPKRGGQIVSKKRR